MSRIYSLFQNRRYTQKITLVREKALTLQKPDQILEKKFQNISSKLNLGKVTKLHEI